MIVDHQISDMETIITRDTDILREYLAVLDARERGLSPFASLAATIKLSRLHRELGAIHPDTTDEDFGTLRREIEERISRSAVRRFEARAWGARASMFLILVIGQQLALMVVLFIATLLNKFAPLPSWWNTLLPHDEPAVLYVFVFAFFFSPPILGLAILLGGRYFRSWRASILATLGIIVLSGLGTFLVVRKSQNPAVGQSSLAQFAKERSVSLRGYRDWVDANWLFADAKFQSDYERYFRNGPGRVITAKFKAEDDAAWQKALGPMNEYVDGGQDPNAFREWLKYYLDRNRIYTEERVDQMAGQLSGESNSRFLGVWQVEPYLKERDQRMYRAYLDRIDRSMRKWGLASLGLFALSFTGIFAVRPIRTFLRRFTFLPGMRRQQREYRHSDTGDVRPAISTPVIEEHFAGSEYAFPERGELTIPPFFDTPFKILARVHRSFLALAVSTILLVFAFWAVVYATGLGSKKQAPGSQVALMKGHLLIGGDGDSPTQPQADLAPVPDEGLARAGARMTPPGLQRNFDFSPFALGSATASRTPAREFLLESRISEMEQRLEETDFSFARKLKAQNRLIASQTVEIDTLKAGSTQLQQLFSPLPQQVQDLGSRSTAMEDKAEQAMTQAGEAKLATDNLEKKVTSRISEVDSKATHASDLAGKVADQTSTLITRAESLEKELDRRARQIEARTEELGERTTSLKDREEKLDRASRVTFTAVLAEIKAETMQLDRKTRSRLKRMFNKAEIRREADALAARVTQLSTDLGQLGLEDSGDLMKLLDELEKTVKELALRVK
jgi:hypothetical protein